MSNTAGVGGDKPIAIWSQSTLGVSAINPLAAFYDIHGRKREVQFFYFVPDTTIESLYLLKKTYQNPLGNFKDLSIHRGQAAESDFGLYYVIMRL
jgi:hypothetical protein